MKRRILFIERHPDEGVSIERVFRQVAKYLPDDEFEVEFQKAGYGSGPLGIVKNLLSFRPRKADIYHVTGHVNYLALLLPRVRTVLTFHDLNAVSRHSGLRNWLIRRLYVTWPSVWVDKITSISDATRKDVQKELNGRQVDIEVIENPLFDGFESSPAREFNVAEPVILHIGTTPNKNLSRLIEAVAGMSCRLRIIGQISESDTAKLAEHNVNFENVDALDDSGIIEEYRNCDIVAFCSTFEGFGLPVIEAQAMRKPLLTSNIEPLRSVAGEGAVLVDPFDVESVSRGLRSIVNDQKLRGEMIAKGAANIQRFEPHAIARGYADLYHRVLQDLES
jgi:glycosyltransferase involved in cell wall biosynthesis